MTLQGALQARELGVAVECAHCGEAWLYRSLPEPTFGPLNSPKRKRNRGSDSSPLNPEDLSSGPDHPAHG